jgi:hypothetical protein
VTDGALTRTVRDAAGLLDAISGRMPGEPYYAPELSRPLTSEVGADPGRLRIGVLDRPGSEVFLDDPQCRAAVGGAARLLESLGHGVEESAPAAMFEAEFGGHFTTIIAADAEATFLAFEGLIGRPTGRGRDRAAKRRLPEGWPGPDRSRVPAEPGVAGDVGAPRGGLVGRSRPAGSRPRLGVKGGRRFTPDRESRGRRYSPHCRLGAGAGGCAILL